MTYLVAVYGETDKHNLFFNILNLLKLSNISYIGITMQGKIHKYLNGSAQALIVETSDKNTLTCGGDILIFKNNISKIDISLPLLNFKNIIIPDSKASFIRGNINGQTIIACGPNIKSSVTISSNINGKLCIFIQRQLSNLQGNEIEPQELPIFLKEGTSEYNTICSALCCILLGVDPEKFIDAST